MPNLGDYLGQLLSEITMARMQADLETVRLAEIYAAHPLLRNLPVPHVRLPDVDLDLPVMIKTSEPPRAGETVRGGVPVDRLRKQVDAVLAERLKKKGVELNQPQRDRLAAALDKLREANPLPADVAIDVNGIADAYSEAATATLRDLDLKGVRGEPGPIDASFGAELKEAARLEALRLRTAPPRVTVAVTTAELREAGGTENVTRLRLKIVEQGLEWTTIESEQGKRDRLVPE
jgi:hypothetical protein